jgi:putative transposase
MPQPRVRDRGLQRDERIRFSPSILPPYARRPKSLDVLIPLLISMDDFAEALAALVGFDAGSLSASTIARLKEVWTDEHARRLERDLSAKHYVYLWVDGIRVLARLEDEAQCILVIIGATSEGKKELDGLADGVRESALPWKELLLDLKRRGLALAPKLVVADGALGFWKAVGEVWSKVREQRCWVHKTANVLNKLPKSIQPKAKTALQNIWMAETRKDAEAAFDRFVELYRVKYDTPLPAKTRFAGGARRFLV